MTRPPTEAPSVAAHEHAATVLKHHARKTGFVLAWNEILDDPNLSLGARGLLLTMLRKPDGWRFSADRLARENKEGRQQIRNWLVEMKAAGYYRTERLRKDDGRWYTSAVVSDRSIPEWVDEQTEQAAKLRPSRVSAGGPRTTAYGRSAGGSSGAEVRRAVVQYQ